MPAGQGETIVVVEDDRAVRELARALLNSLGYRTLPAADGATALALLARHPNTALLFTDVVLGGGMSGFELARTARERQPRLKVLYTSGYTEQDIARNGYDLEGMELIEKPFRIEALAQKVHDILLAADVAAGAPDCPRSPPA